MLTTQNYLSTPGLFQGKSQTVQDLYQALLDKLNRIGPVHETMQTMFVSLENWKRFATALIRNRSIKLVLRTPFKITSARIHSRAQVASNRYDHTVLISSNKDIDPELMEWLREAYQDSQ